MFKTAIYLLLLFLLPFCIISLFNHPSIDDYWSANIINSQGRIGALQFFYSHVSGRYFSHFLMSLINTLPEQNVWIFKVGPILFLLLLFGAFTFFYSSVDVDLSTKQIVFASLTSLVLHIINVRSLFEGLYWLSSTMVYQLCIVVMLFAAGLLLRTLTRNRSSLTFMSLLSAFALIGTYEAIACVYVVFLLFLRVIEKNNPKNCRIIYGQFFVVLIGVIIVISSKGNSIRITDDAVHHPQSLFFAFFKTLETICYYFIVFFTTPANLFAAFLLLPYLLKKSEAISTIFRPLHPFHAFCFMFFIIILTLAFIYFPLYYFESDIPFPRVTAVFYILLSILLPLLLCYFLSFNVRLKSKVLSIMSGKFFRFYAKPIFLISIFFSRNFLAVTNDLKNGEAYAYDKEAFNHYAFIRACQERDTCYVPAFNHWPSSILSTRVEDTSENRFIHMEEYFGKVLSLKKRLP